MNIVSRLKDGLLKTRSHIASILGEPEEFDDAFYDRLEDALITADIGVDLSLELIDTLREDIVEADIRRTSQAYDRLKRIVARRLTVCVDAPAPVNGPRVAMVVGVNGVGKTTTIAKLAWEMKEQGKQVLLGAADTFRAGAIEQLRIWAGRAGVDIVTQQEGSDPASVAFDAMDAARARECDALILDTAGRLHNKVSLMNELEKIKRVAARHTPGAPHEILLVLDATTGQNAIAQAQAFHDALGVTGLIITKLDGTAKGGVALALTTRFGIPIRKVGVGERMEDLQDFDPATFVDAMFGEL